MSTPAPGRAPAPGPIPALPAAVELLEVGPRDGLQSLERVYPLETKVRLIELLVEAGLRRIEVTGFVKPSVIPQLADAAELVARLPRRDGVRYRALVPNMRGAQRAAETGALHELIGLITASETYNRKNSNMTVAENLVQVGEMAAVAREAQLPFTMALSVSTFCPYEGEIPPERVLGLVERMHDDFGVSDYSLATSVGVDGPLRVQRLVCALRERWADLTVSLHLHNTNGMALANALAGAQVGVTTFEGSICGIGGGIRMPYGMAHYGNVATEDLAQLFRELGADTGVDAGKLVEAARSARELLELEQSFSAAANGGTREDVLAQGRIAPKGK